MISHQRINNYIICYFYIISLGEALLFSSHFRECHFRKCHFRESSKTRKEDRVQGASVASHVVAHVKRRLSVHAEAENARLCIYPSITSHSQDTYSSCPRTRPRVSQLCVYASSPLRVRDAETADRDVKTGICASPILRTVFAKNLKMDCYLRHAQWVFQTHLFLIKRVFSYILSLKSFVSKISFNQ